MRRAWPIAACLFVLGATRPSHASETMEVSTGAFALMEQTTDTRWRHPLWGGSIGIALLSRRSDESRLRAGIEVALVGVAGRNKGEWLLDPSLCLVAIWAITGGVSDPFVALGPSLMVFRRVGQEGTSILGASGDIGLWGHFLGHGTWRLGIGFQGPRFGGLRASLGVGLELG